MRLVEMPCARAMSARHRIWTLAAKNVTASCTVIFGLRTPAAFSIGSAHASGHMSVCTLRSEQAQKRIPVDERDLSCTGYRTDSFLGHPHHGHSILQIHDVDATRAVEVTCLHRLGQCCRTLMRLLNHSCTILTRRQSLDYCWMLSHHGVSWNLPHSGNRALVRLITEVVHAVS